METGMSNSELMGVQVLALRRSGGITQADAAGRLGVSVRQVRRLEGQVALHGPEGLRSLKRDLPSNNKIPEATIARITQFKTLSPQLERLEGGASKVPNVWCDAKSAAAFQRQYADDLNTAKVGGYCGALPWFVQDFWIATDSGTIFGGHLLGYTYLSEEAVEFTETEVSLEPSVGNSGAIKFRLVPIAPRWAAVDAEH